MKKLLLIAAMIIMSSQIMAQKTGPAISEMVSGKDYEIYKINDSVYRFEYEGKLSGFGNPVDEKLLLVNMNNRMRTAGGCFIASGMCSTCAGVLELFASNSKKISNDTPIHYVSGLLLISSLVLDIVGVANMINDKVFITPEGVIVKINEPRRQRRFDRSTNVQQMK